MNDNELWGVVCEYVTRVKLAYLRNCNIDIYNLEDKLNRELSMDLFAVSLNDKINCILNMPRVSQIASGFCS